MRSTARLVCTVLLALTVGACSDDGGEKQKTVTAAGENPARLFTRAESGVKVRYPRGWTASARNDGPVPNPALCFVLRRSGARRVEFKLVEYLPPELRRGDRRYYKPPPPHFRYEMLGPSDATWTSGRSLDFQAHRRVFFVGVEVRGRSDAQTKRTIERILDTIHIDRGRCRPTAGVGSRQYYRRLHHLNTRS